jgi:hypothetical protein
MPWRIDSPVQNTYTNNTHVSILRYARYTYSAIYARSGLGGCCKSQQVKMVYAQILNTVAIVRTEGFNSYIKDFHLECCYQWCRVDIPMFLPFTLGTYDLKKWSATPSSRGATTLNAPSGSSVFRSKSPIFIVYSLSLYIYIFLCYHIIYIYYIHESSEHSFNHSLCVSLLFSSIRRYVQKSGNSGSSVFLPEWRCYNSEVSLCF